MVAFTPDAVLAFKPHLRFARMGSDVAFLVSAAERFVIAGRALVNVAALIDGRRTLRELLEAAMPTTSELEVVYSLDEFDRAGYLSGVTLGSATEQAFWHELKLEHAIRGSPEDFEITVELVSDRAARHWASWMVEALEELGLRVGQEAVRPRRPLRIVLTDDYRRSELGRYNASCLAGGSDWLLVKPVGTRAWLGPLFTAKSGPCWQCLVTALRRNRPVEQLLEREGVTRGAFAPPHCEVPASARAAISLAALEVAKYVASDGHELEGKLVELQFRSLQVTRHTVVKRPQCAACGDPGLLARRGETPIRFHPIMKEHTDDGGFRIHSPAETYERLRHLVSPLVGAVTHLGPMPQRNSANRHVYASGYLVCPADSPPQSNVFDKACAGKGRSEPQARASALCEALERASSVHQGDEPRIRSTLRQLGSTAIHLNSLQLFSRRQFEQREALNRDATDVRRHIPLPFDFDAVIDWTPAWSVTRDARRYVPLAYCYSEAPRESGSQFCLHNPNGTAAGNCLEEAVLQGLLELVERDAAAIWWYNEVPRPSVDLSSLADPFFARTVKEYAGHGWAVWALDLTHDLGLPTIAALAHHQGRDRFLIGLGCHLDAELAVQRAVTELNQVFAPNEDGPSPWEVGKLRSRAFLFPERGTRALLLRDLPTLSGPNLRADLELCIERLAREDLEVLVVDKTRPDWGVSVAQVLVPGLRHFWPRFAPGRLYTVPHAMGWVASPPREESVNPVELFL